MDQQFFSFGLFGVIVFTLLSGLLLLRLLQEPDSGGVAQRPAVAGGE